MKILGRRTPFFLLAGDLFFFLISLWLALYFRTFEAPARELFFTHLVPFSFLFFVWVSVFYIAGLYEKHTVLLRSKLPERLANTLVINAVLGVVFFYFMPFLGITPKTVLFIYLVVSFILIATWRMYGYFYIGERRPEKAILIGSGEETKELVEEVNNNPLYSLQFVESIDLSHADEDNFWVNIVSRVHEEGISIIAIDLQHERVEPVLPYLYDLIFSKITFVDVNKIYEDVFSRIPLSIVRYNWFLENVSVTSQTGYDVFKRLMDIILSVILGVVSLLVYPFVIVAIKLDDGGKIFITQERTGKNNKSIRIVKFRSMTDNDEGKYGEGGRTVLEVTKVGKFLRNSRIDELPQLWNVIKGDLSLIGPRPELPSLAKRYEEEISYYNVRHVIKPGLSGWAQIYQENHPHHGEAVLETKEKLAYDLYYVKNRSVLLDLKIALRTIQTLFSRVGK
jgi:exopolysaccharide biosynthesis polyprenyl glycosylphosphotransferase